MKTHYMIFIGGNLNADSTEWDTNVHRHLHSEQLINRNGPLAEEFEQTTPALKGDIVE